MSDPKTTPDLPVLVTGASRGLGAALALELASKGHHVVAVARTVGGLEDLDDRIKRAGGSATLAPMDVTDAGAMRHLCRSIHDRWGGLSTWAHAAIHAAPLTPAQQIDDKDWDKSWKVNVEATRHLIAYVAPLLGLYGQAIFLDDPRGGTPFFGSYGTTKAAQVALAKSWQAETCRTGPKVHILTPDPMPTATRGRFFPGEDRSVLTATDTVAKSLLSELETA